MIRFAKTSLIAAAIAVAGLAATSRADTPLTQFVPGGIVVLRAGDAANPGSNGTQVSLYLDEYSVSFAGGVAGPATYVGTINVPSTGGTALTLPGNGDNQHQGLLNLSSNGKFLTFAGYQSAAGSADAFAQSGAVQPVIGMIGNTAASLTTNTIVNSYGPGSANPFIRGATTNNGTSFWTFGKFAASGATSNGGLAYVTGTGPSATTTTVEGFADWRDIIIGSNGQMYGGTGSSSVGVHAPFVVNNATTGTGQLITPLTQPTTNLGSALTLNTQLGNYPGGQSASALALLNLPGDPSNQNGLNVMYTIGDQSTAGIVKYYFNGTAWINQTNVALNAANNISNPTGIVAVQDASNPNWVDLTVTGPNGIYTYVDQTGYNGVLPANAFTVTAAPANQVFFGAAQAPSAAPEPASLAVLTLAGAGLLIRRRRAH